MKILRPATALAALLASTGCDLLPTEEANGQLPPQESVLIPKPSERPADNTEEQAVCAEGNDVGAAIEARIDGLQQGAVAR